MMTIDWERGKTFDESKKIVSDFYEEHGYTVPVYLDFEGVTHEPYGIRAFPTVYVIDQNDKVRFRNIGSHPEIEEILSEQVASLS